MEIDDYRLLAMRLDNTLAMVPADSIMRAVLVPLFDSLKLHALSVLDMFQLIKEMEAATGVRQDAARARVALRLESLREAASAAEGVAAKVANEDPPPS